MSEYNQYVTAINKIFNCINIMKTKYTDKDNIAYLEKLISYQEQIISIADTLPKEKNNVEELGL